jgi:predicted DNA-binding transcriptional regulator YafY
VGLWYAVGRDLGDDRIKSFRVSRMRGRPAERNADQGPQYTIPEDFNLSEHIRPPWLIGDDETVVEVAFEPQVAHLARSMLQGASMSDMPDGRAVFTVTVLNVDGLVRWLMTFGDTAEVLAPASARTYAQEMRAAMEANRG